MDQHYFTRVGSKRICDEELNQDFGGTFALGESAACVVADGMGGQKRGWEASRIVYNSCVDVLTSSYLPGRPDSCQAAVQCSFAVAHNAIRSCCKDGWKAEDYGTTLMVAILTEGGDLHYGFVGDGAMIALLGNGQGAKLVTPPQIGERHAQTFGLATHPERWQFGRLSDVVAVAVATDGVGNCLIGKTAEGELAPNYYAEEILSLPPGCPPEECWGKLDNVLSVVDESLFGRVVDDRTLAILYRGEASAWPDLSGEPKRKRPSAKAESKRSRFGWW